MSRPARVWVLNLDAENELETAHSYTPSLAMRAIVRRERARLFGSLVAAGDVVLDDDSPLAGDELERARGLPGIAWSPTPRALALLGAARAEMPAAPPIEVLRAVNARPFAALVRAPLAEASFEKRPANTLEEALALLSQPAGHGWLVRRTFGAAGRGRRRIAAGAPSDAERAWLVASLRIGPLVIEPWVQVTREFTRSAWVEPGGRVVISPPCFQATTAHGAWTRTERAESGAVSRADDSALEAAVERAGAALAEAGYFGPFGIDAFRHRVEDGAGVREVLNPLSEINARFTMDWATAMAAEPWSGEARARLESFAARAPRARSAPDSGIR